MPAFRRSSTSKTSSSTESKTKDSKDKDKNPKKKSNRRKRNVRVHFGDSTNNEAPLPTILCEIPSREDVPDEEKALLYFSKDDFRATRSVAKAASRECEQAGLSQPLAGAFSTKSKAIQEQLNSWSLSSDCRGLERWSLHEHGDLRSQEQFSAVMAILQAQQDMWNRAVMQQQQQQFSNSSHHRRGSLNSVKSAASAKSATSTDSMACALDHDNLRKVSLQVTRPARHFARMMGKADSHAVAAELQADTTFQQRFSFLWEDSAWQFPNKEDVTGSTTTTTTVAPLAPAIPPSSVTANVIQQSPPSTAASTTTATISTTPTSTAPSTNNNTLDQILQSVNSQQQQQNAHQHPFHLSMKRNEDDVSLAGSVAESEISNTDIQALASGTSLLLSSLGSEFELDPGGGGRMDDDEDDLLLLGGEAPALEDDDDEDDDFLPQVDELQEASATVQKSKTKKLRLLKKIKRRMSTTKTAKVASAKKSGRRSSTGSTPVTA